jgi:hypothetical protein
MYLPVVSQALIYVDLGVGSELEVEPWLDETKSRVLSNWVQTRVSRIAVITRRPDDYEDVYGSCLFDYEVKRKDYEKCFRLLN